MRTSSIGSVGLVGGCGCRPLVVDSSCFVQLGGGRVGRVGCVVVDVVVLGMGSIGSIGGGSGVAGVVGCSVGVDGEEWVGLCSVVRPTADSGSASVGSGGARLGSAEGARASSG